MEDTVITKNTLSVALVAAITLIGASTVSAQDEVVCEGGSILACVCPEGFHPQNRREPPSATNPCVANVATGGGGGGGSGSSATIDPDVCDPVLLGTESNGRGGCRCTAENRAAGAIGTVPVAITYADRREHGLPVHGHARGCYRLVDGEVTPGPHGDWSIWRESVDRAIAGARAALIAICDQPVAAVDATPEDTALGLSWDEIIEMCESTRQRLAGLNPGDANVDQRLVEIDGQIVQIGELIDGLTDRVVVLEAHDADHEVRITALETASHDPNGANSFTLTLGVMGGLGLTTYGPFTLAGDAMATGLFRPGTAPFDVYLRLRGGAALTGWSVGSGHIAAGAGLSFYLGSNRRGWTLAAGFQAEDLLDLGPDGANDVRGDTIGFEAGGEVNLGIPFGIGHVELGASLGYSERYAVTNGMLAVYPAFYIEPHIGVTLQLW